MACARSRYAAKRGSLSSTSRVLAFSAATHAVARGPSTSSSQANGSAFASNAGWYGKGAVTGGGVGAGAARDATGVASALGPVGVETAARTAAPAAHAAVAR